MENNADYEITNFLLNLSNKYGKEIMLNVIKQAVYTYELGNIAINALLKEEK